MISQQFDLIDSIGIENLITGEVAESKTLEYKQKLPGSSDDDRKEFLADVSAFANTSGGDLIYGISEQRDSNSKTMGIPDKAEGLANCNADEEIRRLHSMIQDGLAPRIIGIQIKAVHGFPNGPIIVIRIPKSWNSPHMVIYKKTSRFHARNSAGKYQLDVDELRAAFIASESLAERIKLFRADRIAKINAEELPVQLSAFPRVVLHLIPIEAFNSSKHAVDVKSIWHQGLCLNPSSGTGWDRRYNFDGFLQYNQSAYTQLFRNGIIEAVDADLLKSSNPQSSQEEIIPSIAYEQRIAEALKNHLSVLKQLQINPPIVVMLSFLNIRGYKLSHGDSRLIERDLLLIPEILVDDYDTDVFKLLQPAFDTVWQACGLQQCWNYNDDGSWVGRR